MSLYFDCFIFIVKHEKLLILQN